MKENSDAAQNQPLKTYIRLKSGSVKQPVDTGTIGEVSETGDQWWIYRDDISAENFTPVSFQFTTNDNATVDYHIFIALLLSWRFQLNRTIIQLLKDLYQIMILRNIILVTLLTQQIM